MDLVDYYWVVRDNCAELFNNTDFYTPGTSKNFITINRLMLNALNSYYSWLEFAKRNKLSTKQKQCIESMKRFAVLDFANRLRHKTVHFGPIVSEICSDVLTEEIHCYIDVEEVFSQKERDGFSSKIKRYLSNPKLDALCFISDFIKEFDELHNNIRISIMEDYQKWMQYLFEFVPKNPPDCYNCYIVDQYGLEKVKIGQTMRFLSNKQLLFNEDNLRCGVVKNEQTGDV